MAAEGKNMSKGDAPATATSSWSPLPLPSPSPSSLSSSSKPSSPPKDKVPVKTAPPPMHSMLLVVAMSAVFVSILPSSKSLDQVATMDAFTKLVLIDSKTGQPWLTIEQLSAIRFIAAAIVFGTMLNGVLSRGKLMSTPYALDSKLIVSPIMLKGPRMLLPFTSVAWNLLGCYFLCSGIIAHQAANHRTSPRWLLRTTLILWEIAAPLTLLVAAVVRYGLWPEALKNGSETDTLKHIRPLIMHNLNVVLALTESALLSGLPVFWNHVALAPLVGLAYVIFTWNLTTYLAPKKHGPQFIYYFFDTTLPGWTPSLALIVLLVVFMVFYGIFVANTTIVEQLQQWGPSAHFAYVFAVAALVVRFRD